MNAFYTLGIGFGVIGFIRLLLGSEGGVYTVAVGAVFALVGLVVQLKRKKDQAHK